MNKAMIVIVDYGMGNLSSIQNMLRRIGIKSLISSLPADIRDASKLILPGVGAFDNGMKNIAEKGILPVLNEMATIKRIPILGICLGMQLLTRRSDEGSLAGLGWINADTHRFKFDAARTDLKIPHMGWNSTLAKKEHPLCSGLDTETRFYFVHSFHVVCDNPEDVLMQTHYGYDFTSAIQNENIMGTQFHPEKSHKYGMQLLKNFVERM
jgi:imidazole glycerol-phosphate synthase subunit HisH